MKQFSGGAFDKVSFLSSIIVDNGTSPAAAPVTAQQADVSTRPQNTLCWRKHPKETS
jgi:hypothetical protein